MHIFVFILDTNHNNSGKINHNLAIVMCLFLITRSCPITVDVTNRWKVDGQEGYPKISQARMFQVDDSVLAVSSLQVQVSYVRKVSRIQVVGEVITIGGTLDIRQFRCGVTIAIQAYFNLDLVESKFCA